MEGGEGYTEGFLKKAKGSLKKTKKQVHKRNAREEEKKDESIKG